MMLKFNVCTSECNKKKVDRMVLSTAIINEHGNEN